MPATATERIPMSWDEYVDHDLGDRRTEYIDGALVEMEAPNRINLIAPAFLSHPTRTLPSIARRYALHAMPTPATEAERIPMSWDEYVDYDLGDRRTEYIDGALVVSPAPTIPHQRIARRLAAALERSIEGRAQVDVAINWKPGEDEFGPDVVVYEPTSEVLRLTSIPYLAVEILSTKPTHDTVTKFGKYAAAGLPRYWIVDPAGPEVAAYKLKGGAYRGVGRFGPDDVADLDIGPARVRFRPADLLR